MPLWLQVCFFAIIIACVAFVLAVAVDASGLLDSTHDVTCRYVFTDNGASVEP